MRRLLIATFLLLSHGAMAEPPEVAPIIDTHVLPGFANLAETTKALQEATSRSCDAADPTVRATYHDAFDAWIRVSHLRFGPTETDNRAFALAFWPDSRGATPRTLRAMIADADPVVASTGAFGPVSVAARGFYSLEFLLFDPGFLQPSRTPYGCALIRAVAADTARTAAAILDDWRSDYADRMRQPGSSDTYRTEVEAAQQFFTALTTGLQFTSGTRLGRPLGTFDRPRPNRAEAWRSGRSLRHVILSLQSARALARLLSGGHAELDAAFQRALQTAGDLDDPVLAGVADPQGRFAVEILQQRIDRIRALIEQDLGPELGFSAGFNALDGD